MGGLACAAVLWLGLLLPSESRATPGPLAVALEYSAVPACPTAGDFKAIVTSRLGYDAFRPDAPDHVAVNIATSTHGFEGRIEWRNAQGDWAGDRSFPSLSDDCHGLARAMAFALALQIQLSARVSVAANPTSTKAPATDTTGTDSSAPSPGPSAATQSASAVPGSSPTESEVPAAAPMVRPPESSQPSTPLAATSATSVPASGATLAVGAGASIGLGFSPSPVPFGRVFGSVLWPQWSMELAAEVSWPETVRRADGAGFSEQQLLASIAGCRIVSRVSACLLVKGGAIRIAGQGVDDPASPWGPMVDAGARLALMQSLGRFAYLALKVEGLLIVTRWTVTLDQHAVWTSPRLAGSVGLDFGVRFPE